MIEIEVIKGDITTLEVDAIVNAANTSLLGGGGVDGAIHRKGGKKILEECVAIRNKQGGCATGEAVFTTAGNLPAKYVIHTVGPVWQDGTKNEPELLKSCYQNTLRIADELNVESIAFPSISTGIYKYPKQKAAEVAVEVAKSYQSNTIKKIQFVCFDDENFKIYEQLLKA
jgi:O-acetyl-ADP-ribose deacetylase (regulator of RNase III)